MWERKIIGFLLAAGVSGVALVGQISLGQVSVGHAQVQGLDDLYASRGGCPGGFVEGLGCSRQRPPVGPGIQDSDQGWQRDWQAFGAGDPGLSIYSYQGWGYGRGGMPPVSRGFGGPLRN